MQQKRIVRLLTLRAGQFAAELGSLAYIFGDELILRRLVFPNDDQAMPPSFASFSGMIAISPRKELLRCNMVRAFMHP
jgi:hypothetical protein